MRSRGLRAVGASLLTAALAVAGASVAAAAPGVSVSQVSSLPAGALAGTLTGRVVNETDRARTAEIVVRTHRRDAPRHVVGRTSVRVPAKGSAAYRVGVRIPPGLARGTYYLSSCTRFGGEAGLYGCAIAERELRIGGGTAVRGRAVRAALGRMSAAAGCGSGARTLSLPGMRVYPEMGNGGYVSLHTEVANVYDAAANLFLPGNHVELTQRATQCLTDFSLDFERRNPTGSLEGPDMTVNSVLVDGRPAAFRFVQPTYPGDPNGQDDPDPKAHEAGLRIPVSDTNPNPPACSPPAAANNQCPANKLVITPSEPIPAGAEFRVTVDYTGRPGTHRDADLMSEGWFRVADGSFVTTEPVGTMAWMPLNNHPSAKPTYDFRDTVAIGKTAIANGQLIGFTDNPPDANFPAGSRTWRWHSPEPIASYLVENSIGDYDLLPARLADSGVLYYQAQATAIDAAQKARNKAAIDRQEDITLFQQRFNGPFPFSTNGVVVGRASDVGFAEEMQTKITFANPRGTTGLDLDTLNHENMHQWWGDNVSEAHFNLTFFKEGFAQLSEYLAAARTAAETPPAEGLDTPSGDAAFEQVLTDKFNLFYGAGAGKWAMAPSNPTANALFSPSSTYDRPAAAYIALWRILGKANFSEALKEIQRGYGGGSITEPQLIEVFHRWMPNRSAACQTRLDDFFRQWWDTAYPSGGDSRPQLTGPGLDGPGFYDAACPEPWRASSPVSGTVSAQLSLTLGPGATFGTFTPGLDKDYAAQMRATVTSTAGDGALSVTDASANAPGHLVNGTFPLPAALAVSASSPGGVGAPGGALGDGPLGLETWRGPVSNDPVTLAFKQSIAKTDALRTGRYSKTLTFTLSTTQP